MRQWRATSSPNSRTIENISICYVMLYGYLYSASCRRLFRGTLSMTGRWKEKSSNYYGRRWYSHSGVQEEYHSKVQDPQLQMPGSGHREVWDKGTRRSQRSAERSRWEERADSGLDMSSHRYLSARPCWDLATRSRTLYLTRARIGSQCNSLIM